MNLLSLGSVFFIASNHVLIVAIKEYSRTSTCLFIGKLKIERHIRPRFEVLRFTLYCQISINSTRFNTMYSTHTIAT